MIETRLAYHPGQRLEAAHLTTDAAIQCALSAAHIRAVHGVCGVVCGFEIRVAADARSVNVSPGLAYDAAGDELVVLETTTLPVPAWQPQGPGKPFDAGLEIHRAPGAARAAIRWTLSLEPTRRVCGKSPQRFLLAVLRLDAAGSVAGGPNHAVRNVARVGRRQEVFSRSIGWSDLFWHHAIEASWAEVDTSMAGFAATPVYFVRFAGEPEPQLSVGILGGVLLSAHDPRPAGFRLNATVLAQGLAHPQLLLRYQAALIEWTAVESFAALCAHSPGASP